MRWVRRNAAGHQARLEQRCGRCGVPTSPRPSPPPGRRGGLALPQPREFAYGVSFNTFASLPKISSIVALVMVSGGDSAMMSPVVRTSKPAS